MESSPLRPAGSQRKSYRQATDQTAPHTHQVDVRTEVCVVTWSGGGRETGEAKAALSGCVKPITRHVLCLGEDQLSTTRRERPNVRVADNRPHPRSQKWRQVGNIQGASGVIVTLNHGTSTSREPETGAPPLTPRDSTSASAFCHRHPFSFTPLLRRLRFLRLDRKNSIVTRTKSSNRV